MGNNFDAIWRLVVPGILLLIWAVNQLFNKELNPGANRLPAPGPRPNGLPPAPRPMERLVTPQQPPQMEPQPRHDPTMRFGAQTTTERRGNDEVLFIRAEPQRSPTRPGPPRPAPRQVRPKPPAPPAKRPDTVASRSQMVGVSQSVNQSIKLVGDVGQMTVAQSLAVDQGASAAVARDPGMGEPAALDALRRSLADPTRLREAWIISELLKPPVALRGRTRN